MQIRKKYKLWVRMFMFFTRPVVHKPKFHNIDNLKENAIIITNHNTNIGPASWVYHFKYQAMYWGNYRCFESYKLSKETAYQDFLRLGNPKWIAKLRAIIGAKLLMKASKAKNLIFVYDDIRVYKTIKDSIIGYKNGDFVIIYADDPSISNTYDIKTIKPGALMLAKALKEEGIDPNIVLAKLDKKTKNIYLDNPLKLSEYENMYSNDNELLEYFKNRINNLDKKEKENGK
jgi:hypothetical protein